MKILVTGPGKLGRPLLARLAGAGLTGRTLSRSGVSERPPGWEDRRADITDAHTLAGICEGCDLVLHLAALTHSRRARDYDRVNADGTANLLAEAARAGVSHFVHVSTRAVAPDGGAYSRSKLRAEVFVRTSSVPWTILRPAEVYGVPGDGIAELVARVRAGRFVPVVGDGAYLLAPVFCDDVRDALSAAVLAPPCGATHVLAGPAELSYLELVRRLARFFGTSPRCVHMPASLVRWGAALAAAVLRRPPLVPDQVARLLSAKSGDIASARADLGFAPRSLEEGLERCLLIGDPPRAPR